MENCLFVVMTISDSCSAGTNEDKSGPLLVRRIREAFPGSVVETKLLPDDEDKIAEALVSYCDDVGANVILTTGGTGFSGRDVTPEATRRVIDRPADGISVALLAGSLKITPMAMLSRLASGIRKRTLVVNFPGSAKAAGECFDIIRPIVPHAVQLLSEDAVKVKATHADMHECVHRHRPGEALTDMRDAKAAVRDAFKNGYAPKTTQIDAQSSCGRVTAEDVFAAEPFPPFRASIKDGYACHSDAGTEPRLIKGNVSAGDDPNCGKIEKNSCLKINTGAPVPEGADCVVMVEDAKVSAVDGSPTMEATIAPQRGQDIRPVGSDIKSGEKVIPKNKLIGPADVGLFATVGKLKILVYSKPIIGILSTGSELSEPDAVTLPFGHIRDSNKGTLLSLFRDIYGFQAKDFGIVTDDRLKLKSALSHCLEKVDILITTGGVSMGDKDFIKDTLKELDFKIHFDKLNMRPGKPTVFATRQYGNGAKFVFGLPGNPVSALVTSRILVIPALMQTMGLDGYEPPKINVTLKERVELDPRPHYARAIMEYSADLPLPVATVTGNQISSRLMSFLGADILLELPGSTKDRKYLNANDVVPALLIK